MGKDFSLFSVIESSLTKSVGHDKIASITPSADRKLTDGFVQYSVVRACRRGTRLSPIPTHSQLFRWLLFRAMRITRRIQDPHTYARRMTDSPQKASPTRPLQQARRKPFASDGAP